MNSAPAITCSTAFSALPPGWVQAIAAWGPGMKKSRPDRAADGTSACSNSSTEIRWPSVAVACGSLFLPRPNGSIPCTVLHEARVTAIPLSRATLSTRFMVYVLKAVITGEPERRRAPLGPPEPAGRQGWRPARG